MAKKRIDTYEVANGAFRFLVNKWSGRVIRSWKVDYEPAEFRKAQDGSWWQVKGGRR